RSGTARRGTSGLRWGTTGRRCNEPLVLGFERRARSSLGAGEREPRRGRRFLLVALPRRAERPPQPGELGAQRRVAGADTDGGLVVEPGRLATRHSASGPPG